MRKLLVQCFVVSFALFLSPCRAFDAYGIVPPDVLLKFDTALPQQVTALDTQGFVAGEIPVGADIRPSDGLIYVVTRQGNGTGALYRMTLAGTAQRIGTLTASALDPINPYTSLPAASYGADFDPVLELLRVTSSTGLNLRIVPANATVLTDTPLNPGSPNVHGIAHSNNVDGATSSTLYAIDVASNDLFIQNPENGGTLTEVGSSGLGVNVETAQFDIVTTDRDYGFAAMVAGDLNRFFAIDLGLGRANLIGSIELNPGLVSLSIVRPDELFANGFE